MRWQRVPELHADHAELLRWAVVAMTRAGEFEVLSWHASQEAAEEAVREVPPGVWFCLSVAEVRSEWLPAVPSRTRSTLRAVAKLAMGIVGGRRGQL